VAIGVIAVLYFALGGATAIGFVVGAVASAVAGYVGMNISVRANVRTTEAATKSMNAAMKVAVRGGSVTGLLASPGLVVSNIYTRAKRKSKVFGNCEVL